MAKRERKDDPIENQKRVMDATIARSEAEPLRMVAGEIVSHIVQPGVHNKSSTSAK
jgi:hypothetical protein